MCKSRCKAIRKTPPAAPMGRNTMKYARMHSQLRSTLSQTFSRICKAGRDSKQRWLCCAMVFDRDRSWLASSNAPSMFGLARWRLLVCMHTDGVAETNRAPERKIFAQWSHASRSAVRSRFMGMSRELDAITPRSQCLGALPLLFRQRQRWSPPQ